MKFHDDGTNVGHRFQLGHSYGFSNLFDLAVLLHGVPLILVGSALRSRPARAAMEDEVTLAGFPRSGQMDEADAIPRNVRLAVSAVPLCLSTWSRHFQKERLKNP